MCCAALCHGYCGSREANAPRQRWQRPGGDQQEKVLCCAACAVLCCAVLCYAMLCWEIPQGRAILLRDAPGVPRRILSGRGGAGILPVLFVFFFCFVFLLLDCSIMGRLWALLGRRRGAAIAASVFCEPRGRRRGGVQPLPARCGECCAGARGKRVFYNLGWGK